MLLSVPPAPYADFIAALEKVQSQPLWDRYHRITTRHPKSLTAAHLWPWAVMEPLVDRAAREVAMADAERRVLLFTQPEASGSVDTMRNISGGLQTLLPGEVAHAHRHTLAALRFVMCGRGAVTTVNDQACAMDEGDLVLTPSWTWHEHSHPGAGRMVWFDGLDLPLLHHIDSMFFEMAGPGLAAVDPMPSRAAMAPHAGASLLPDSCDPAFQPSGGLASSRFSYNGRRAIDALAGSEQRGDGSRWLRYVDASGQGPVLPTLDCYLLSLEKSQPTQALRSTSSAICVVAEGEGISTIGGKLIAWRRNDVFTLPHWQWATHTAATAGARLFVMSDRELIAGMGYLREEVQQKEQQKDHIKEVRQ